MPAGKFCDDRVEAGERGLKRQAGLGEDGIGGEYLIHR